MHGGRSASGGHEMRLQSEVDHMQSRAQPARWLQQQLELLVDLGVRAKWSLGSCELNALARSADMHATVRAVAICTPPLPRNAPLTARASPVQTDGDGTYHH
ncbi:hypothetical protein BST61_g8371 [Cercospora zeina]